jgi:hypothetical protein
MRKLVVLYEDGLLQDVTNFGPHVLLLACVADHRAQNESPWGLAARVESRCCNGVDKLIAIAPSVGLRASRLLAPDDDKIRSHLQRGAGASPENIVHVLAERTDSDPHNVILIVRNMDDVVREAARCVGLAFSQKKPKLRERDLACHRLAAGDRSNRDRFLTGTASFKAPVDRVAALLASPPPAAAPPAS